MRTHKLVAAALAALCSTALGVLASSPEPVPTQNNTSTTPQATPPQTPSSILVERCQLFWKDERVISSKIPGKMRDRLVQEGDRVQTDQILAVLDDRDAKLQYDEQKVLAESDLAIRIQKSRLDEYYARSSAADLLISSRAISLEEYRLAKVNVDINRLQHEQEVEKHHVEKIKYERAKVFLDDHTIRSPINGIVSKAFKREKESLEANDLRLFQIQATDWVWVEGWVPVRDMYRVHAGQRVEVQLSLQDAGRTIATPEPNSGSDTRSLLPQERIVFQGRVIFKDPNVDFAAGRFRVRAEVENQDEVLQAGLRANMRIVLADGQEQPASAQ